MIIRKLTLDDKDGLSSLISEIENTLDNKEFWLPINETSRIHFFDEKWTRFFGIFEKGKLIAASGLFLNPHEFGESLSKIPNFLPNNSEVVEIGRAMVHPKHRGNNYLFQINTQILEESKKLGKKYVIVTIHPDNIPSKKSFEKLGLNKVLTYKKSCGFIRDIYMMEL